MKLVKKLYGVNAERGGLDWLEEIPDHIKAPSSSPDHALLLRFREAKSNHADDSLKLSSIEVQSPYLKQLIRQILGNYPGENVDTEDLAFDAPFYPFFHLWPTYSAVYEKAKREKDENLEELEALMTVLEDEFEASVRDAQNLTKNGNITFRLLWTLFPPGSPVLGEFNGKEHLLLINNTKYLMTEVPPTLLVEVLLLDYNGERFGWRKSTLYMPAFSGTTKIAALPVVPYFFSEDAADLTERVYTRGRTAVDYLKHAPAYKAYEGDLRLHRSWDADDVEIFVEGRIMIEPQGHSQQAKQFSPTVYTLPHKLEYLLSRDEYTKIASAAENSRQRQNMLSIFDNLNRHTILSIGPSSLKKMQSSNGVDSSPLANHRWTEAFYGIPPEAFCRSAVRGYCLQTKCWAEFEVDCISEIEWNTNAFKNLVIPPTRKRLLEALVRQQKGHKAEFDDVVKGKGQGLIMLLAGPPGTGKTLTAESIADHLQLPLYAVSAHELGDTAQEIEGHFGRVLRLAGKWDAVLLLDEADAFLEKRVDTPEARDRNKRVAGELSILLPWIDIANYSFQLSFASSNTTRASSSLPQIAR